MNIVFLQGNKNILKLHTGGDCFMNVLNSKESFTLKWLIFHSINVTSIFSSFFKENIKSVVTKFLNPGLYFFICEIIWEQHVTKVPLTN